MNLFHSLAVFFVDLLPAGAPEWAVGSAVTAGIALPGLAALAIVGVIAAKVEKLP